jgi:hypothetical protein
VSERRTRLVIAVSCVMCLVALALMVWSILAPTPLSVMVAMSVAQGIGTLSLLLYLWAVIADMRRARVFDHREEK